MSKWSIRIGWLVFVMICVSALTLTHLMMVGNEIPALRILFGLVVAMGAFGCLSFWKNGKLIEDIEFANGDLENARKTRRQDAEYAETTLKELRDSSAKETGNFVKQLARADEKLAEADKLAELNRKSLESLSQMIAKLRHGAENAAIIIGGNVRQIRSWSAPNVSGLELKSLRNSELTAAHELFDALERFNWDEKNVPPSACRDYVVDMIAAGRVDITKPWIANFIRFAHRKEASESGNKAATV